MALLNAATRAFSDRGWLGARMEDIAEEAGVSVATAFNHFPTKHALAASVYGPIVRPAFEKADRALGAGGDAIEVLERHVRDLARISRRHRELTVVFLSAVAEYTVRATGPPLPDDLGDPRVLTPLCDTLVRVIAAGQATGELRRYPPASQIGSDLAQLVLIEVMTRPRESAADTAELILTILFGTLQPQTLVSSGADHRPFAHARREKDASRVSRQRRETA